MISANTVLASDCTSEKKTIKIPKFAPENFSGSSLPKIFAEELRENKGKTDGTSKKNFREAKTMGIPIKNLAESMR